MIEKMYEWMSSYLPVVGENVYTYIPMVEETLKNGYVQFMMFSMICLMLVNMGYPNMITVFLLGYLGTSYYFEFLTIPSIDNLLELNRQMVLKNPPKVKKNN